MSLDEWQFAFTSICTVLVLSGITPVVMLLLPRNTSSSFLALGVLGSKGRIGDYFPRNISTVKPEEIVNWNLYLYNHMGSAEYVAVRVKLLNSTMLPPNSTLHTPSPTPAFFEVRRVLMDNETWLYPFTWYVLSAGETANSTMIKSIGANDEVFQTDALAVSGRDFRIVFELWVYDETLKDFAFSWSSGSETQSIWNQIWFSVSIEG
jgi:hypothetical protein